MQISSYLMAINLAQNANVRPQIQISQGANSFESELTKANLAQQNSTTKQTLSNLDKLDLPSENFFEDFANAYYKETGDLQESMAFMVVEKFLALAKRGMQALGTDDIAKGFEFGLKQWQETPKTAATNKTLLNEMLAIAEREPILYSNDTRLDEYRARAKAFAQEALALFDKSNSQIYG